MRIFIPTVGREDRQFTLRSIPDRWKDRVFLVCPEHEVHDWPNRIDVDPSCIGSVARTFQWITETATDKHIAIVDDDLNFYRKVEIDKSKTVRLEDAGEVFDLMEQWLEEGDVYCGLSNSYMCQNRPAEYYFGKPSHSQFFDREWLLNSGIRWDDITYYTDFHVPLSIVESGQRLRYSGWYIAKEVKANGPGGNSLFRTAEKNRRGMEMLAELHPDYVKVWDSPGATNQSLVIDKKMRIEFAKAYKENVKG